MAELEEGGLKKIDVGVNFLLLALIEALALFCRFGRSLFSLAHEFTHFDEVATWFPILPAYFRVGVECSVIEGKKPKSPPMVL